MSEIKRARERLIELCEWPVITPEEIMAIVNEDMYREKHAASPGDRAKNRTPTPEQVLSVRYDKLNNPRGLTDLEIGFKNGIKVGGRVSEILYGKMKDGVRVDVYDAIGVKII